MPIDSVVSLYTIKSMGLDIWIAVKFSQLVSLTPVGPHWYSDIACNVHSNTTGIDRWIKVKIINIVYAFRACDIQQQFSRTTCIRTPMSLQKVSKRCNSFPYQYFLWCSWTYLKHNLRNIKWPSFQPLIDHFLNYRDPKNKNVMIK